MKYDLSKLNGKPIIEAYPSLAEYSEFAEADDMLLAYVILSYDRDSPLMGKHKNAPAKRQELALEEAGFQRGTEEWNAIVNHGKVYSSEEEVSTYAYNLPAVITAYLRLQNDRLFTLWVSNISLFDQVQEEIRLPLNGIDEDKKSAVYERKLKLSAESVHLNARIKQQEEELFPDGDKKTIEGVTDYVQRNKPGRVESRLMANNG